MPVRNELKRVSRREVLAMIGVTATAACGGSDASPLSPTATTTTVAATGTNGTCEVSPSETIGPYPSLTGFIRSDIRERRSGTPLALTIDVIDVNNGCAPVRDAAVDVWPCDAEGHYSQYAQP